MVARFPSDPTRRAILTAMPAMVASRALGAQGLTVLAAASLKPPLDAIAATWDGAVSVGYGSSGTIARQAAAGVPADLVILAARDWMDWLDGQGALAGGAVPVARNRLVLAGPPGSAPVALEAAVLEARLGPRGRVAMGDPMSVPAGRYGQQALETLGLWGTMSSRMVLAENVRAALAYVVRGDVAMGVVYRSDTVGTDTVRLGEIPPTAHAPILYPAAMLSGAAPEAEGFLEHIRASEAIFAAHGFGP